MAFNPTINIVVLGLGYVGLPLAVALARTYPVLGFDIDQKRITELGSGFDRTHEITPETLAQSKLKLSSEAKDLKDYDIYIVTVPTPVDDHNQPDLRPLAKASETVGKVLKKGSIVVYESTVYPGVTEEFCGPILEKFSGLKCGQDFFLGYSPERINPGDKEHTIDRITKVVSGQTKEVAELLKQVYGSINHDNIFLAKDIKTAEAAKVIENAQRDINIAFINEIATIAVKLDLSIHDILAAANTKWNFLNFKPGLVGGHCIGVDPYYLAHCARKLDHEPEIILAGRRTNENMGAFIAESIHQKLASIHQKPKDSFKARILILGVTFKENIPDLRNTKVLDLIKHLKSKGHELDAHDSMASAKDAKTYLGIDLLDNITAASGYDCIVAAVSHQEYLTFESMHFEKLLNPKGLLADVKNIWREKALPQGFHYWSL